MSNGNAEAVILAKDATLRDMFAAKAMQGLLAHFGYEDGTYKGCATVAYVLADAMILERNK